MKEYIDCFDEVESDNPISGSKKFLSRDILIKQNRNMKRMHSNSILNELRLNEKINQGKWLAQQQKSLSGFSNSRRNSKAVFSSCKRMSDMNVSVKQNGHRHRVSQFFELDEKKMMQSSPQSKFANESKTEKQNKQNEVKMKKDKGDKKFVIHEARKKKKNSFKQPQPRNLILSSIKNKLRQIDVISKTFDKVNEFYAIEYETAGNQNYNQNSSETFKILKQFGNKLNMRKNKITERRNSTKKNIKLEYRYKVQPKRYQTESQERQTSENNCQGLWHQNARKMKNYISGGYTDQKEEYSEFCDIEEYRNLKNNFRTFEQIYNNIKQDKDNPIGKIYKSDLKQPNILEVVSLMEKQHEISASKKF